MGNDKLKLEEIAGYLPYVLKFISELDKPYDEFGNQPKWTLNGITYLFGDYCFNNIETNDAYPISLCKPLLYPLSSLTPLNFSLYNSLYGLSKSEILETPIENLPYGLIKSWYHQNIDIHNLIGRKLAINKTKI